jgi:hypothetical protein
MQEHGRCTDAGSDDGTSRSPGPSRHPGRRFRDVDISGVGTAAVAVRGW